MGFGRNNLQHFRMQADMTQAELAEKSGVDESSISRVEKGVKDLPGQKWMAIATVLDCSIDELLGNVKAVRSERNDREEMDSAAGLPD